MNSSTSENLCRRFSLAELNLATGDFSEEHVIGKGGFGKVYKGFIDNEATAIKRRLASNLTRGTGQGQIEFAAEIETLSKFRHRNLVSLIGYCDEQGEMILVYDYMWNGTLADHLHKLLSDSNGGSSLSWNERLKICIGAGRGLDYLHSGCSIIHRDVKPTNILLDENFVAKVSDFGLAKHLRLDISHSHVFTNVKGSFGYFDPSYFSSGILKRASDTYAFGIVLLEVLSGRPAIEENLAEDEMYMSMWAQEKIRKGKAYQIVASNLKGDISQECLKTFVEVVKGCLDLDPKKRLTMSRVVVQLELALEQQERKGTTAQKLQFWPFRNRAGSTAKTIPATAMKEAFPLVGPTPKDQSEVEVDKLSKDIPATATKEAFPLEGSTQKDQNEVEVDEMSKDIPFTAIKEAFPLDGLTQKDQNEVEVDKLSKDIPATATKEAFPLDGSTQKDQNEAEVDKLSKDIPATATKEAFPLDGSTQKDQNEVEVDKLSKDIPATATKEAFPLDESTPKDQNEAEVDEMSKDIPATAMKEDDVYFIIFGEAKGIDAGYITPVSNSFEGVIENGLDANIERWRYCTSKHGFESRVKVSRSLSKLKHENVVELVVYHWYHSLQILAYDFAPRGSLRDILHKQQGIDSSSKPYPVLSWSQRIQIALGVAKGICYIHGMGLIHHNIRSSNILICDDDTAKIIDPFLWPTLCRYCRENYCVMHSHITQKIDVYNFGEILFELLTGSNINDSSNSEPAVEGLHQFVDARLKGEYPPDAVMKMIIVARSCLRDEEYYDRKMVRVVKYLELCLHETKSQDSQG
ncbi:receptor-like kinase LIP1 isoform X1 [Salvia hispanica]|uniref:receptor-like kinase LIP1 isoform X1 n=1 Tax=Salvia hispanica TaxID=49212 RepID=UPI0020097634|nr:receptor-like kinase LIP1 isoform X1 [Salvia hispanica]